MFDDTPEQANEYRESDDVNDIDVTHFEEDDDPESGAADEDEKEAA